MIWAYWDRPTMPELPDWKWRWCRPAPLRLEEMAGLQLGAGAGRLNRHRISPSRISFDKEENEILDIKKHCQSIAHELITCAGSPDPRPVIKINPHAGLPAGGRLPAATHLLAHRAVPDAGACLCASAIPGENIFGQSFVPVTDTKWIYTYARIPSAR